MNYLKHSDGYEDEDLVKATCSGNLDAFNQLILKYQDMVYDHARVPLDGPDLAEDVAQASFIKAFQNIRGFRGGSFRSWLLRIVTNSAYDIPRTSRRHSTQPLLPEDPHGEELDSLSWLVDPGDSVQDTVEQREFSEALYTMPAELPEVYRNVLTLVDIFELDYAETVDSLDILIGTVKSRIVRARIQMQKKNKKEPETRW